MSKRQNCLDLESTSVTISENSNDNGSNSNNSSRCSKRKRPSFKRRVAKRRQMHEYRMGILNKLREAIIIRQNKVVEEEEDKIKVVLKQ